MNDVPAGPDWWQASDGKWYPPSAKPQAAVVPSTADYQAAGWWQATDGRWYPPQAHPHNAPVPRQAFGYQPQRSNPMATTGGTIGIAGAVLSLIPLIGIPIGLVMGLLAVVFSGVGLGQSSRAPRGKGLAVTGLVLGIITIIFKLIPGINLL